MKLSKLWLLVPVLLSLTACGNSKSSSSDTKPAKKLTDVSIVLDYVPNTNHTGLYVAKDKGYFKDAGLNVKIIEPGDNATSVGMVGANKAQFGVSYQEDVTYAHADGKNIPVKAIGTVIKHNTSGFVSKKSSGITSPKDFVGKTYAGWQTPSEEAVLKAVMSEAKVNPKSLKIVGATGDGPKSLGKKNDIQWWFQGWDVIRAKDDGIKINYMPLRQLDKRLDYYTPVIITNNTQLNKDPKLVKAFMKATKKGYQDAIAHPKADAKILHKYAKDYDLKFLEESQAFLSKNYTDDASKWGQMDSKVWNNYTGFMKEYGLIKKTIPASTLYTNQYVGG
ncbi:ABC transporter substrate-binding protein [Levilactobacillus yonginensis]|uniref:ABC transporter substrate-binding protein n=1 Tax=Levilactobacillus yonginensis TaxID=1054041 RepID=UPI000F7B0563|nr:ABC transporter substrate-binding protein [Levilactobacillus yonginensis]